MVNKNFNRNLKKHRLDKNIRSPLSENLRKQYNKKNARVIKGDTVKVLRGEYKNVEGKVEKVKTGRSTLSIEGIQREVTKGGKVKVQIHSSNVVITSLNLQDKLRENIIKKIKLDKSKSLSSKPDLKKSLNIRKVLKSRQKTNTDLQLSQDNKGEK